MNRALLIGFLLSHYITFSTHLRSAEIIVERVDCNTLTFRFKVIAYTNTLSGTPVGGNTFEDGSLAFGDGSFAIIPQQVATVRPDLGPNIGTAEFVTTHTYQAVGSYIVNYFERDRSGAILNMFDPGDTPFSAFVLITAQSIQKCSRYPRLSFSPVDKACPGVTFFHNPGAVDPDGDSLSYELTLPAKNSTSPVDGYLNPASPQFYSNFNQGNEDKDGQPSFLIDSKTGLITWDAPGSIGDYNIAFRISEWRTNTTTGIPELLSVTIRDMQITVENCINGRPTLTIPEDLCVVAGTLINEQILGFDPEKNKVKIEISSDAFSLPNGPPLIYPGIEAFRSSSPYDSVRFRWQTNCSHVRDQAYQVVVKITDLPNSGVQLVSFKTWTIRIIAPAPIWRNISLDLVNRKSVLAWEQYSCANAETIQVWRKVGSYNYTPGECDAGLPKYLGYELVGEVAPSKTSFVDNNSSAGLVDGALYCYRLVAAFSLPAGGKSYVTAEQCVGPIITDAPVITHVSVEETSKLDGVIRVSWRSPFKIDKALFPEPYQYHIYRANGFSSTKGIFKIEEIFRDTTFLDASINTTDSVYNYRIVIYSKPFGYPDFIAVDTSFAASSLRLQAIPGDRNIELMWSSHVPWSNIIDGSAYHYVYRGGLNDSNRALLAKADITENGFTWIDKTVDSNEYYCYTVMSRGTYGNPKIDTLRNFSQRVCLYPKNNLLPCPPVLEVQPANCDELIANPHCDFDFENNLSWSSEVMNGCRVDIEGYKIYSASGLDENFVLLQDSLEALTYTDSGLPAFARCYKISAIDSRGHESELSEPSCNDNCTLFELPNIFTPDIRDGCNDTFRAVMSFDVGDPQCGNSQPCMFFVKKVSCKIYDRWGKEMYSNSTVGGMPADIQWTGVGSNGKPLEGGIYYYLVDVEFDLLDASKKYRSIKGWVHLIR